MREVVSVEPVKYNWRDGWYARVTYSDGTTWHPHEGWLSRTAAEYDCAIIRRRLAPRVTLMSPGQKENHVP